MVLSAEQERVRSLIADTVSLLCKNGLHYTKEFSIEGLLGITLDRDEVFLVNIKEIVKSEIGKDDSDSGSASEESSTVNPKSPSARRRRRKRQRKNTTEGGVEAESDSDNETNSNLGEPPSKNIKQENEDSSDDLVFVKNEPGIGSNNFGGNLSGATSATNDILSDLSQQGQLYATPTSNPLSSPAWDPQAASNSSLYNTTLPHQQQPGGMNVMSPTASPGGSNMQQLPQQQARTLQCPQCQKKFTSSTGYRDHVNSHKGVFRYQCPQCDRGFAAKKNMLEHLSLHTGLCYFTCTKCEEKFPNHYQLSRHKSGQGCGGSQQPLQQAQPQFPTGQPVSQDSNSTQNSS